MLSTCVPSATTMLARCGLASTRSVLNRPSARILPSSSVICGWTLVNIRLPPLSPYCLARAPAGAESSLPVSPFEYNFAAFASPDGVECGGVVDGAETVSNDRADVDACPRQDGHLIPRLEHLPAIDAL